VSKYWSTSAPDLTTMMKRYLELTDRWCSICQGETVTRCRTYEGCKDYHHFNICEECARKEGYLW